MSFTMKRISIAGRTVGLCVAAVPILAADLQAQKPWEKHGLLRVSSNKRYLEYADETPFFWLGSTAWGMTKVSSAEMDLYISNRKAKGFTLIHYCAAFGHGTSPAEIISSYEPLTLNESYWKKVDMAVTKIKDAGMHCVLFFTWGSELNSHSRLTGLRNDLAAYNFGKAIALRYRNEPHIIYSLLGEYHFMLQDPKNTESQEKLLGYINQIGMGVKDNKAPHQLTTIHPGGSDSSSDHFHNEAWLDFNMHQSNQKPVNADMAYELAVEDWKLIPVKPVIEGECVYGGWSTWNSDKKTAFRPPISVRRAAYFSFQGGAKGYTYGYAADGYKGTGGSEDVLCTFEGNWKKLLDTECAFDMIHVKNIYTAFDWHLLVTDPGVVTQGTGSGLTRITAARSNKAIVVYYPERRSATIMNKLAKAANAAWHDPRNGKTVPASEFVPRQSRSMNPPQGWEDAVLVLMTEATVSNSGELTDAEVAPASKR